MIDKTLVDRNIEIREYIKKNRGDIKNMSEFAKKNNLSRSRLYQIIESKEEYCKKHNTYFYSKCDSCNREKLTKNKKAELDSLFRSNPGLVAWIKKCSKYDRSKELTTMRIRLVKTLVNDFKLNFTTVGKLIKRHHSAVIKMYNKHENEI